MAEREGTREDFLRMLGRTPQPLPPEDQLDEAPISAEHHDETPELESTPSGAEEATDLFLTALFEPKPWQRRFIESIHPPSKEDQ